MLGGYGGMLPRKFLEKWCDSVHSRAHCFLQNFAFFFSFFVFFLLNVACLKTMKKKNLKCNLMVFKAVLTSETVLASKKKTSLRVCVTVL